MTKKHDKCGLWLPKCGIFSLNSEKQGRDPPAVATLFYSLLEQRKIFYNFLSLDASLLVTFSVWKLQGSFKMSYNYTQSLIPEIDDISD